MSQNPFIFCALDTDDLNTAAGWARTIGPVTGGLKIGLEFYGAHGTAGIEAVREACPDAALFIDLKFHDIPNTVAGAVRTLSGRFRPAYLNVHAGGGPAMMKAAREACDPATKLLAVTVLTSLDDGALRAVGQQTPVAAQVESLARLAQECGLDGVVCSAHEIALLRQTCGPDFILMVPGIRPAGVDQGDQKRVMTPKCARAEGASHIVIGRPITQAPDPARAARDIAATLSSQ